MLKDDRARDGRDFGAARPFVNTTRVCVPDLTVHRRQNRSKEIASAFQTTSSFFFPDARERSCFFPACALTVHSYRTTTTTTTTQTNPTMTFSVSHQEGFVAPIPTNPTESGKKGWAVGTCGRCLLQ